MDTEKIVALTLNGATLIGISWTFVGLSAKERKTFREHILILLANSFMQLGSIWTAFADGNYKILYSNAFFSQCIFFAANWQMIRILDMFKFLSAKVTPRLLRVLRYVAITLFVLNEIIMLAGLPFVIQEKEKENPGKVIISGLRMFVLLHVGYISILSIVVSVLVTSGIRRVTRGDEALYNTVSAKYQAYHDLVHLKVAKVYRTTCLYIGISISIFISGLACYAIYSNSQKVLFLYLAFGGLGLHAIVVIRILHNFSNMISTFFKKPDNSDLSAASGKMKNTMSTSKHVSTSASKKVGTDLKKSETVKSRNNKSMLSHSNDQLSVVEKMEAGRNLSETEATKPAKRDDTDDEDEIEDLENKKTLLF